MPKKTVDVVSNTVVSQQEIVIENAIGTDVGAFAPARALQVGGTLVSESNRVPINLPSTQRTPSLIRSSGTGTAAAGSVYVSFANIGSANATVAGTILDAGLSVDFPSRVGETLGAITYDATNTTLLIVRIA